VEASEEEDEEEEDSDGSDGSEGCSAWRDLGSDGRSSALSSRLEAASRVQGYADWGVDVGPDAELAVAASEGGDEADAWAERSGGADAAGLPGAEADTGLAATGAWALRASAAAGPGAGVPSRSGAWAPMPVRGERAFVPPPASLVGDDEEDDDEEEENEDREEDEDEEDEEDEDTDDVDVDETDLCCGGPDDGEAAAVAAAPASGRGAWPSGDGASSQGSGGADDEAEASCGTSAGGGAHSGAAGGDVGADPGRLGAGVWGRVGAGGAPRSSASSSSSAARRSAFGAPPGASRDASLSPGRRVSSTEGTAATRRAGSFSAGSSSELFAASAAGPGGRDEADSAPRWRVAGTDVSKGSAGAPASASSQPAARGPGGAAASASSVPAAVGATVSPKRASHLGPGALIAHDELRPDPDDALEVSSVKSAFATTRQRSRGRSVWGPVPRANRPTAGKSPGGRGRGGAARKPLR